MTYGISTIMALNNNFILWVCIVSGGGVLIILSHVFEVIDMRIDSFNYANRQFQYRLLNKSETT